jgi:hypothetical protein
MTGECGPVFVLQDGGPYPDPCGYAFVAFLGRRFGPHDAAEPSVVAGRACLEQAV